MMKKIYENVEIGKGSVIEDFVIIGIPPRGKKPGEQKTVIGKNALIRAGTKIYAGNKIGDNFQTGHDVMVREGNTIGENVSIGTKTVIEFNTKIGNNVRIHSNAFIPEYCELEDNCYIGPNVVMTNTYHPLCDKAKECLRNTGVKVCKGAKIGANSTLLPCITIGENALVGAGSVVINSVGPGKVVCGNPAKEIADVSKLKCKTGLKKTPYSK